jgi:hypothetical protein
MFKQILLTAACLAASNAMAQSPVPCYFGECDSAAPKRVDPPPPVTPAPPVIGRPPDQGKPAGQIRLGNGSGSSAGIPEFLRRNMCFAGNVALMVNDAKTCAYLYQTPTATQINGSRASCAVLFESAGMVNYRIELVSSAGECFDKRNGAHLPLTQHGLCQRQFNDGFAHWRYDLSRRDCQGSRTTERRLGLGKHSTTNHFS